MDEPVSPVQNRRSGSGADPEAVFAPLPLLLSVPRAAEILGISRASAYKLADSGELPARRLGGRIYIVTQGLRDLVWPS